MSDEQQREDRTLAHRPPPLLQEIDEDGICVLTLNRPGALNALDGALVEELRRTFEGLAHDDRVRVVILTGAGPRAFCAGADLQERATMSEQEVQARITAYGRAFGAVEALPKPVICAINGYAFGGGLELALCADIRLMARNTRVGLTECRLGIIPGAGGTQRLPRLIGASRAKELIFTAARVDGERAQALGLVSQAVDVDELMQEARRLAQQMLACAPIALAQAKIAVDAGMQADLATGLQIEGRCYQVCIPTEDRLEGLAAFREKRDPEFKGR